MNILKDLVDKRCEQICNQVATKEWYLILQDEIIKIRNEICNSSGPKIIELLEKYDNICLELSCKTNNEIYTQALNDASQLTPFLTPKTDLK